MGLNSNVRILKLREILFEETDEMVELSMEEIIEKLQFYFGEEFDKRTINKDMEVLEESGFDIVRNKGRFGKLYYSCQDRIFETYQIRLINDAVLSARFITEKEKKTLISKVKQLTSKHIARTLPDPLLFSQSSNESYEMVKLNIDHVHRAITDEVVLHYKYGRYNMDKEFQYSRDGMTYEVEPYALIWQNDYYYLIGYFPLTEEMRHYRLDRMREVRLTDKHFRKHPFPIQDYVDQSFHMFAGQQDRIKIQFHVSLLNVVLDRFGMEACIQRVDEEHFLLSTKAKMSKGLVSWVMQWGSKAKVISPANLVEDVQKEAEAMFRLYT
ncbi:helix-turn-helix transcriptional regulator [Pontibacillus litoralis]|uniref:Transcriptional regulator n=1 Tax=Pontibacillus litoralis JSM 072002 TaxID=1385512 RepID=A0A0A5G7I2_9BACI|nr:WYL domain-containing protein [Pontibacillus litoralis]KGX87040.1 transcriptional regulator [Pontibacillus litoralis JSM 072002]